MIAAVLLAKLALAGDSTDGALDELPRVALENPGGSEEGRVDGVVVVDAVDADANDFRPLLQNEDRRLVVKLSTWRKPSAWRRPDRPSGPASGRAVGP